MVKSLINLEKKLYFPGELVKGVLYVKNIEGVEIENIKLMVQGIEQIRFSKWVNAKSHNGKQYLKQNPKYTPVNDKVLVDELDFNKFINHWAWIYEKGIFEQMRQHEISIIDGKINDIKKEWDAKEQDIYEQFDREALDYEKQPFTLDLVKYPEPTIYKEGDFQFPFQFRLPDKLPGR